MNTTFNYNIPFNTFLWKLLAAFVVATIIGFIVPFDIQYRRGHFSNQMLIVGGALLSGIILIIALLLYMKSENSKKNPNNILLNETSASFPVGANEKIEIIYNSIESITEVGNKFNGEIVQLKSNNGSFKPIYIQANGFDSMDHYSDFLKKIKIYNKLN